MAKLAKVVKILSNFRQLNFELHFLTCLWKLLKIQHYNIHQQFHNFILIIIEHQIIMRFGDSEKRKFMIKTFQFVQMTKNFDASWM